MKQAPTSNSREAKRLLPASCVVCGGTDRSKIRTEPGGHSILECAACGVWSVNPLPDPADLAKNYDDGYYAPWVAQGRARRRLWNRRVRLLRDTPRGRLLDVGCAEGAFLQIARDAGFQILGSELSPYGGARTAQWLNVPVYCGDLPELEIAPGSLAAVTFWHVLEHTLRPGANLAAAHRLLAPGGRLIVAVPNRRSPTYRALYRFARGRRLHLYHPEDRELHLQHWDPSSLRSALEHHRFEVESLVPDRCALSLGKRLADCVGRLHSVLAREPRTSAMVAVARRGEEEAG